MLWALLVLPLRPLSAPRPQPQHQAQGLPQRLLPRKGCCRPANCSGLVKVKSQRRAPPLDEQWPRNGAEVSRGWGGEARKGWAELRNPPQLSSSSTQTHSFSKKKLNAFCSCNWAGQGSGNRAHPRPGATPASLGGNQGLGGKAVGADPC